jgi:hypothetical protein
MNGPLTFLLRIAGAGLILLAALHVPIGRHLKWNEDIRQLSLINASIFRVHTFFICFMLVMMGLPCLLNPWVFLEGSVASGWIAWSFSAFWLTRLFVQWFVYPTKLWRGKKFETVIHAFFSIFWLFLTVVFAACAISQKPWLR